MPSQLIVPPQQEHPGGAWSTDLQITCRICNHKLTNFSSYRPKVHLFFPGAVSRISIVVALVVASGYNISPSDIELDGDDTERLSIPAPDGHLEEELSRMGNKRMKYTPAVSNPQPNHASPLWPPIGFVSVCPIRVYYARTTQAQAL